MWAQRKCLIFTWDNGYMKVQSRRQQSWWFKHAWLGRIFMWCFRTNITGPQEKVQMNAEQNQNFLSVFVFVSFLAAENETQSIHPPSSFIQNSSDNNRSNIMKLKRILIFLFVLNVSEFKPTAVLSLINKFDYWSTCSDYVSVLSQRQAGSQLKEILFDHHWSLV